MNFRSYTALCAASFVVACFDPSGPQDSGAQEATDTGAPETAGETSAGSTSSGGPTAQSSATPTGDDDTSSVSASSTAGPPPTTGAAETDPDDDSGSSSGGDAACIPACENAATCVELDGMPACDCTDTGFAGPTCAEDIDECAAEAPACSAYAVCTNEAGSFDCECGEFADGDPFAPAGCCPDQERFTCDSGAGFGPCEPFAASADELVRDGDTGLVWARFPEAGELNWAQAHAACEARDMRLPDVDTLESIVDALYVPTWMPCVFEAGDADSFWSSTPVSTGSASSFVVHFSFGGTGNDIQANDYGVRCVQ